MFPTGLQEAGATGYVPRGQVVALYAQVGAPATLYKPGAQAKQEAGALTYVPAGHDAAVKAHVDAPTVLKLPEAQGWQEKGLEEPWAALKVPAAQRRHVVELLAPMATL